MRCLTVSLKHSAVAPRTASRGRTIQISFGVESHGSEGTSEITGCAKTMENLLLPLVSRGGEFKYRSPVMRSALQRCTVEVPPRIDNQASVGSSTAWPFENVENGVTPLATGILRELKDHAAVLGRAAVIHPV